MVRVQDWDETNANSVPNLDFPIAPFVKPINSTTVEVQMVPNLTIPTNIKYVLKTYDSNWSLQSTASPVTISWSNPFQITGLNSNLKYVMVINPVYNGTDGSSVAVNIDGLPSTTVVSSSDGNPRDDGDSGPGGGPGGRGAYKNLGVTSFTPNAPGKSFLKVATDNTSNYKVASKQFDSITLPAYTTNSSNGYITYTTESYHVFGTSIYLQDNKQKRGTGGMGFFIDNLGKTGYYIEIQPTQSASAKGLNAVRLFKSDGNSRRTLATSQNSPKTTVQEVYQMTQYNIDVYVKVIGTTIIIKAYINNFLVEAIDTNTTVNKTSDPILPPSKKVGLMAGQSGVAYFDYVYAKTITKAQYDQRDARPNLYTGNYSNDLVDLTLGDIVYNSNNSADVLEPNSIEDFGTVAREIYYTNAKFKSRPAYPIAWSSSSNDTISILGQKRSNFSSEAYVLNNTSTTTTINDGSRSSLFVYGNVLGEAGDIEYSTDTSAEYVNKEPVIFKSVWIQNQADAKNLGDWIKSKVINKGNIVDMQVFGNPLLNPGDVISVKYTYQGFAGTEKMIVTKVSLSYNEGLETRITARTL